MGDTVYVPQEPGVATDNDDVVVGDSIETLLEANPNRTSALVINNGEATMRVTTDGSDPTPTHGKPLPKGGVLVLASPRCPTNEVKAIREGDTDTSANASEVA